MSRLVQAMALLRAVFNEHANKDGDATTLTKQELRQLLCKELGAGGATDKDEEGKFFSMLDEDKDGVVDFKEYVTFVTALTVICSRK